MRNLPRRRHRSEGRQEDLRVGTDVIEVPIKVLVCGTCGERYYDRRTVRYLKEIERKLKAGTTKLREVGKVRVYGHSE